jgi:hypothetical protein
LAVIALYFNFNINFRPEFAEKYLILHPQLSTIYWGNKKRGENGEE